MDRENQEYTAERRLSSEERHERIRKIKRKRRFRRAIALTAIVLVACILLSPVLLFAVFRIRDFAIEGQTSYSKEEIVAASGITAGKSIFFADLDEAKVNIEKKLPYADNVQLARRLPGTLVIALELTGKAYAVEKSEGIYAITNRDFKVLEITGVMPKDVVPVIGAVPEVTELGEPLSFIKNEGETDATLNLIQSISSAISDSGLDGINLISIRSRSNIYIIYQERMVLRLGDSSDIAKKVALAKKVIQREDTIVSNEQTGIINLTVPMKAYFKPAEIRDIPEIVEYRNFIVINEKDSVEEAYAIKCKNGSYAIVNPAFKVLSFADEAPEGIIPIDGYMPHSAKTGEILSWGDDASSKETMNVIRKLYKSVSESGIGANLIGFDSDNDLFVICNERVVMRMGSMGDLDNKLSKGKSILAEQAEDAVGIIDLNDLETAEFVEKEYADIPELAENKPLEEESSDGEETTEKEADSDDSKEESDE